MALKEKMKCPNFRQAFRQINETFSVLIPSKDEKAMHVLWYVSVTHNSRSTPPRAVLFCIHYLEPEITLTLSCLTKLKSSLISRFGGRFSIKIAFISS